MVAFAGLAFSASASELPLSKIALPDGFNISIYSDAVPGARSLAQGPDGTVFVSTRRQGKVYALRDADGDGRADQRYVLAENLNMPNGVAFRNGALYIAEVDRILRLDNIEAHLANPPAPVIVNEEFPSDQHHGWKFIRFGPDGKLYVPIGAPCNVCDEPGYARIMRMNPDGSGLEVFATGVRNTVGFDWHPVTGELWFTDNGRDRLGDDAPPDELNHAPKAGMHFGFPFCHGGFIADPDYGSLHGCDEFEAPAMKLGPHVASLGMRFYTGHMFPEHYHQQVLIAEHGSWNRSSKIGYRVMLVRIEGDKAVSYEPFASGWLQGESEWGRPVDLEVLPDGSLLVSDDKAGAVYRISYK
jgi:glucose/arabinose dehydrogenase